MSQQVKAIWYDDFQRECETAREMGHILAALPSVSRDEYCNICNLLRDLSNACFELLEEKGFDYNPLTKGVKNSDGELLNATELVQRIDEFNQELKNRKEKLVDDPLDELWDGL